MIKRYFIVEIDSILETKTIINTIKKDFTLLGSIKIKEIKLDDSCYICSNCNNSLEIDSCGLSSDYPNITYYICHNCLNRIPEPFLKGNLIDEINKIKAIINIHENKLDNLEKILKNEE